MTDVLVDVQWLADRLGREDVAPADCRFDLADPEAGRRAYEQGHIPGALYFHLDDDLSRPRQGEGGRHPLPPVDEFVRFLESRGIGDDTTIVCYDDGPGGMAGRLWWMLRFIGHRRVALLDGGWAAWTRAGLPVETMPRPLPERPASLTVRLQYDMMADVDDVRKLSASGDGVIVDSRAPARYRGEVEPLDPVAGHIPGAINLPWEENVEGDGRWRSAAALAERFADVRRAAEEGKSIVVHCGSGVTGCANVFALERLGVPGVKLYVGGWSDWCSDPSNPVATGDASTD